MNSGTPIETPDEKRLLTRRLDAAAWGAFFTWIGIALLARTGWGVWLVGVGLVMLAVQLARRYFALRTEPFALGVGVLFVVGGIWQILEARLGPTAMPGGLVPIVSIVGGVLLFVSALRRSPPEQHA